MEEEGKSHYVLIKNLYMYDHMYVSTFMYDHTLDHGRKPFRRDCLQAFNTEEILKCYVKDCFETNGKQKE